MSENKHTPEPWSVDPDSTDYYASILDADGADTILLGDYVDWWMTKANARRIVACVNACAGCATEVLETAPVGFFNSTYGHPKYFEEITKQLAEAKKDAERYRWLRDTMTSAVGGGVLVNDAALVYEESEPCEAVQVYWYPDTPVGFYESKADSLDEAIDAAIRKLGEQ